MDSVRADRQIGNGHTIPSYKPVGVVLRTTEDLEVFDIPGEYNKDTGIPGHKISKRWIKAGETFYLTYYELMFLMLRPEFSGFFTRDGDDRGVFFSVKTPKYFSKDAKLPTPTLNFTKAGSPKEVMDAIDMQDPITGEWVIRPEYREKFGSYIPKVIVPRQPQGSVVHSKTTKSMVGLASILAKEYGEDFFADMSKIPEKNE